jgi:1-aminocyclopropane-1-carboxylate deaminase
MLPSSSDFLNPLMQGDIPLTSLNLPGGDPAFVARLDLIHPTLSGNKIFKLWYFLEAYSQGDFRRILTYGGAWSNHLHATAYLCHCLGIPCTGVVRGEAPPRLSPTLEDCRAWGMELQFVSRSAYAAGVVPPDDALVIPEGGGGSLGVAGAALIADRIPGFETFTHILCAVGTGTTLQGIARRAQPGQRVIGIPVLAIPHEHQAAFGPDMEFGYSFGGYAKRTPGLLEFMKSFPIPTDFVYTAKAAYALWHLAWPKDSRILFIHTGGLQGNRSI